MLNPTNSKVDLMVPWTVKGKSFESRLNPSRSLDWDTIVVILFRPLLEDPDILKKKKKKKSVSLN